MLKLLPAAWRDWELPVGVQAVQSDLDAWIEHVTCVLIRDSVLDGYALKDLPHIARTRDFRPYCKRWDFDRLPEEDLHPHLHRNYIIPPIVRADRESPSMIAHIWGRLAHVPPLERAFRVLWLLFVRRATHNFPPSWGKLCPQLMRLLETGTPADGRFCSKFRSCLENTDQLYGRGSHWFHPDINTSRKNQDSIPRTEDTVQLSIALWAELPFVFSVCRVCSPGVPARVQALLMQLPGISTYAVKFLQGDMVEIFRCAGRELQDYHMDLRTHSAVGPALRKLV